MKRAIVLAAGQGRRLGTAAPKPLARVAGAPLLGHVARTLAAVGIGELVVVVGHGAARIEAEVEAWRALGGAVELVHNPRFADRRNGWSLLQARAAVSEPCLLTMADHLYGPELPSVLLEATEPCVVAVDRDAGRCFDLEDATKVALDGSRVVDIGKGLPTFDALDTGVFRIGPSLVEALEAIVRARGDASLSDGVRRLARDGCVTARDVRGAWWIDVDTPEAAAVAARRLSGAGTCGAMVRA